MRAACAFAGDPKRFVVALLEADAAMPSGAARCRTRRAHLLQRALQARCEFALGHLPNALNIPLRELEARLGEIDPQSEVVAYCRGPYCVLSYEAVAQLRLRGFNARRLEDGLPEWRAARLPVVAGNA
jgi:ArsR family transcriptional regulator